MHERPRHRPCPRHLLASGMLAVSVAALGGCATAAAPEPEPAPSPAPSLTQEQQDAGAFEDLYSRLLGIDENAETRSQLADILDGSALDDELEGAEALRSAGKRVEGRLVYSGFEVTEHSDVVMIARVCSNTSGTTVVDSTGSPAPDDGDDEISLSLKATRASAHDGWRISEIVRDDGVHACE